MGTVKSEGVDTVISTVAPSESRMLLKQAKAYN